MQRWILLGLVAVVLVTGGGAFAFWTYRQNRPSPVWVPMPINRELTDEKRMEISKELEVKLKSPDVLTRVSKDLGLAKKWGMASDAEAAGEISKRLFIEFGETDTPMGKTPSMNIGVRGPKRDVKISGEIAIRLMQDVWKILGIKAPATKEEF